MIEIENLNFHYPDSNFKFHIENLKIDKGQKVAVIGPSGYGKTTFLNLISGILTPDEGNIIIDNEVVNNFNDAKKRAFRISNIGFIFQDFQLLPTLTALENVSVPLELQGVKGASKTALELLSKVGLAERAHHYPSQLSGGEKQRVAMARAFSNSPSILFADEPTGNLDEETGERVIKLLFDLNKEAGTTLVIVSHDLELARKNDHKLRLKGGKIFEEAGSTVW